MDEVRNRRRFGRRTGRLALRIAASAVGGLILLLVLQEELGYDIFDPTFLGLFDQLLIAALFNTLFFMGIIIPTGLLIGFLTGWGRVSKYKFLSYPAIAYIDVVRGVPQLVLVLFAYFFGPIIFPSLAANIDPGKFFAAMALALHTGAYQAEIFRAGFKSVPRGQMEASVALGLTRGQGIGYVILPQMFRLILPALANELASVLKDTSYLGVIGAAELFGATRGATQFAVFNFGRLDWVFGLWTITAFLYFTLTLTLSKSLLYIEGRHTVPGLGSVSV